jgi:hypothetical protein
LIHDLNYKYWYTKSKEDICKADRFAIGDFFEDWTYNLTHYHSAIGGFLLGGKYLLASVFGVKYPKMMAPPKPVPSVGWSGAQKINEHPTRARTDA